MRITGTEAEQLLIAELCHQINSPLAAIRNALYLSAARSYDPALQRYLDLANAEVDAIASILRRARMVLEDAPESEPLGSERGHGSSCRAAA